MIDPRSQTKRLNNAAHMLAALMDGLGEMWRVYALLSPDGHPSGPGEPGQSGEHSDPTGAAYAEFADGIHQEMVDLDEAIDGVLGTLAFAREIETRAAAQLARRAAEAPIGQGWCRAHCGHFCPGTSKTEKTVEDRLRGGLCDPCRKYQERNHIVDLAELQMHRRGHVGNCQCEDCKYQAEKQFVPKVVE